MRLGKLGWMLVVAGVVMAGCTTPDTDTGPDPEPDTGRCSRDSDCSSGQQCELATGQCVTPLPPEEDRNLSCTASMDCLSSELCHPTAKVCVQTCASSTDCPDSAKTCAPLSATDSRNVCHCSTDALCNQGRQSASLVCSGLDSVCAPRCAADADCGSGRTCDTATGQCGLRDIQRCLTFADCLSSELCHPTAGVCVQTCASSTDCPDSAKTCAEVSGTDSRKVCQCSTDALCNAGRDTAGLVCSDRGSVCAPKCTADVDCGQGRCNTETGQCQEDSTGLSCMGEGQSNCDYGTHFCDSGRCAPLPAPGCINYTDFPNTSDLSTTAFILYGARQVSTATDTAYCPASAPKRVRVAVSAYFHSPFPTTKGGLAGFFYVNAEGTRTNATDLVFPSSDYTVSGTNRERAEIILSLCFPQATRSASMGFYFTQGNFLCFQASF